MLRPYRLINTPIQNTKSIVPGIGKLEMARLRGICLSRKSLKKSEIFNSNFRAISWRFASSNSASLTANVN
ncbi:hypothetical protein AVDCRST_MAG92-1708 [uncultured Coleofasciculus sp.]|uniref:Uncharacterized protein n=1 Tax=uncultured Coleofasciculus sp. TaxID=1267456 RepID=A0A6J4I918_9CYAN|nr:hypothetical protein AVDCRST_MAG92-1708 [uncultured Coleofasciculus sp.]